MSQSDSPQVLAIIMRAVISFAMVKNILTPNCFNQSGPVDLWEVMLPLALS